MKKDSGKVKGNALTGGENGFNRAGAFDSVLGDDARLGLRFFDEEEDERLRAAFAFGLRRGRDGGGQRVVAHPSSGRDEQGHGENGGRPDSRGILPRNRLPVPARQNHAAPARHGEQTGGA